MRSTHLLALASALTVATVACSLGGATPTATPTPPPTNTPQPPTPVPSDTPEPEPTTVTLPESAVVAVLGQDPDQSYKVAMGSFAALSFEEGDLPAPPGSVEAHWYIAGDRYVVAYVGLDMDAAGPLCPGNSILTPGGFESVSNAPTEEGACEGFPTLSTDPVVGPRICAGTLLYVTAIPSTSQGMLFGTLEALADDGASLVGVTSAVESSAEMPVIDLDQVCG